MSFSSNKTALVTASVRRSETLNSTIELAKGDYIDVRLANGSGSASLSLDTSNVYVYIDIERLK